MNLTQLSHATGLPIATTYRLAKELTATGLLERNKDGTYQIGTRVWELGALARRPLNLAAAARPALERLHRSTGEFVQLAALDGSRLLVIDRLMSRLSVANISIRARRLPLHATAVGKVHLAWGPPDVAQGVLRAELARYTAHTIVDAEALTRELDRIAAEGVAYCREELTTGTSSVAAPVFDADGEFVAAVGVLTRPEVSLAPLAPAVSETARAISLCLEGRGPAGRVTAMRRP